MVELLLIMIIQYRELRVWFSILQICSVKAISHARAAPAPSPHDNDVV
jgi:hypothetical protein